MNWTYLICDGPDYGANEYPFTNREDIIWYGDLLADAITIMLLFLQEKIDD